MGKLGMGTGLIGVCAKDYANNRSICGICVIVWIPKGVLSMNNVHARTERQDSDPLDGSYWNVRNHRVRGAAYFYRSTLAR